MRVLGFLGLASPSPPGKVNRDDWPFVSSPKEREEIEGYLKWYKTEFREMTPAMVAWRRFLQTTENTQKMLERMCEDE